MKIRQGGNNSCADCGTTTSPLFKIQGQTGFLCARCLEDFAGDQSVEKTLTIDGVASSESEGGVGELVLELFNAGTSAHLMHLQTKSFAAHKALDDFYNSVIDLADTFAEAYQGKYGVIEDYPTHAPVVWDDPAGYMEAFSQRFKELRSGLELEDSELQNLLDECASLIDGTMYKLKTLS